VSGSSRVDLACEYFHLRSETPCLNFAPHPDDPGFETRFHRDWKESASAWLDPVKPILEQRFSMLAASPDPEWPLLTYDEERPLWHEGAVPETPPPWRVSFHGMNGPGLTEVTVLFAALPTSEARERFRQELIKDVALPGSLDGGF
jgi:hypothetical protein